MKLIFYACWHPIELSPLLLVHSFCISFMDLSFSSWVLTVRASVCQCPLHLCAAQRHTGVKLDWGDKLDSKVKLRLSKESYKPVSFMKFKFKNPQRKPREVWLSKLFFRIIILKIVKWKPLSHVQLTRCNPKDYTVHGILQARILEWVAFPFSSEYSWPRNQTRVSCFTGGFFTNWAMGKPFF